ncbi:uncharacterized protein LOC134444147, partial [Engraulis encrasicolus]|uniref:uncharacterized protein LOC134444147 n=1 Tax=Engraulis encrasicolus TaxID=184585 RepID=UPI002FD3E30B
MESDLEEFLLSRALAKDRISLMKRDKIDKAVLALMTDSQLARYIPAYGDRLATVSFCNQQHQTATRETLLERIKEKIGGRKMTSKGHHTPSGSHGMARKDNKNAEKQVRKIEIGWLHYNKSHYTQVRTRFGGGTRCTTVNKETTVQQVMETAKQLFFPDGLSNKGPEEDFDFEMRDFKRNLIPLEDTVGTMYESTKLRLLRFYICSKDRLSDQSSVDEDSDCATEDPEDQGRRNAIADPGKSSDLTNLSSGREGETENSINIEETSSEHSSEHSGEDLSSSNSDMEADSADTVDWSSDFEPPQEDEVTVRPYVVQDNFLDESFVMEESDSATEENAIADPGKSSDLTNLSSGREGETETSINIEDTSSETSINIDTSEHSSEHSGEDLSNAIADPGKSSDLPSLPLERLVETETSINIEDTSSEHSGEDLS